MPDPQVRFAQIKLILDDLVAGRDWDRMREVHSEPNFGWDTVAQLCSVTIRPTGPSGQAFPLIDMNLVKAKQGANTNLVRALRDPTGVDFNGKMPFQPPPGKHATPSEIQLIVDWLNAGMPE
jgi:hypothetical protein